jgi:hypothetical protein
MSALRGAGSVSKGLADEDRIAAEARMNGRKDGQPRTAVQGGTRLPQA